MKINLLSSDVYNRIAAGEVVDRPYSVVKELVENAIDAGATEIAVEIEGGGKKLIRVTDNGEGMDEEDLRRAYLPHATSKLRSAEDLAVIFTLGFRGEALASVASVSRMQITTKTKQGDALSLACEGGVMGEVQPAAGADGTQVTVRDLFYNTPARLKFLKSDGQEEGDAINMISRFLLSRPEIAFTCSVNGKVRFRSFGGGLREAIAVVYGKDTIEKCYEIDAERHGIRLRGFLGDRDFGKPNRSYQSLFVNGRYVVNQTAGAAISNAYANYLMKRQYPFYVLFLDVPPGTVDVNVHPNKADVRFADNQIVYGTVYSVVSSLLDGNSRALEYLVPDARLPETPMPARQTAPAFPSAPSADGSLTVSEAPGTAARREPGMTVAEAVKELSFDLRMPVREPEGTIERKNVLEVRSPAPVAAPREDAFEENKRLLQAQEAQKKQDRVDPKTLFYKGELFHTFLIYEAGDCAYLIDQHAAHERLLFDKLMKRCESRQALSQPMLLPFLLDVNAQEFAFLKGQFETLRALGFEIEEFGGNSVKISALPVDLYGMDPGEFLSEVLSSMDSLRAVRLADLVRDRLAMMACKAAVKGGDALTEEEARALIEEMDGDMGLRCPHGRPAAVRFRKSELEKLFKRIV